jgi:hypothetical protein
VVELARPRVYKHDDIADLLAAYIDENELPLIEEFCVNNDVTRDTFYRLLGESEHGKNSVGEEVSSKLSCIKKRADQKAEAYLVKNALGNKVNPVFSMFMLKQARFGWRDKQEIEHTGLDFVVKRFDSSKEE